MWRDTIAQFISERLQAKLDKLKDDDPKRVELLEQYQVETWINNAARRVMQIQAVTHSLKPIHPDARGSNLYVEPSGLPPLAELGSHALILAENTPAETFVDNADRRAFDNWAEHEALYPQGKPMTELPHPRAKARRQLPEKLRAALDARAAALFAEAA